MHRNAPLLRVLLAVALVLSVAACGSDSDAKSNSSTDSTPASTTSTPTASTHAYTPAFASAPCPQEVAGMSGITCGRLTVPERRGAEPGTAANDRVVRLFVTRMPSRTRPAREPVVVLQGGPGDTPDLTVFAGNPLRDGHEVIVLDQRGTARSLPSLACPEVSAEYYAQLGKDKRAAATKAALLDAVKECRARLVADGIDLAAYNTNENASDVADLRVALGIDRWDVAGTSYGSRLALTVLRDHPRGVRAVGLSGIYPPDENIVTNLATTTADAFDGLFAAYPGLRAKFVALVGRLERNPVRVEAKLPDGRSLTVRFDGDNAVTLVREAMYTTDLLPLLPVIIDQLASGQGFDAVAATVADQAPRSIESSYFSFGMSYSVQCQEDIPRADVSVLERASKRYPSLDAATILVEPSRETCAIWNVGKQPESTRAPVRSSVPVVMFTGALDPATSPAWLKSQAKRLTNGFGFVLPGYGHDVTAHDCARAVRNAFFLDPGTRPTDACLDQPPPPS